ncbi:MAG: outer membrane lipoprotein-sorting protein [Burkholderiales bacterium]|nr:outer membrane lipoprotein-sorting protein [Burkholderiales bacterium]
MRKLLFLRLILYLLAHASHAEDSDARDAIERVEKLLWGKTMQGEIEMAIATPRWQRTLQLKLWMNRPHQTFVRLIAPAKEAGIGSLRIASEMWNYLPSVERSIKIPPSMMMQPWMGSDFSNDDMVKESSALNDYSHKLLGTETVDGKAAYLIESLPKPEAAVVWGKVIYLIRKDDFIPLKESFFNERGELMRVLTFSELKTIDGRLLPTRWEMRTLSKPGNRTLVILKDAQYDRPLDPEIFTMRNLQRVEK